MRKSSTLDTTINEDWEIIRRSIAQLREDISIAGDVVETVWFENDSYDSRIHVIYLDNEEDDFFHTTFKISADGKRTQVDRKKAFSLQVYDLALSTQP